MPSRLESSIEKACTDYASTKGLICIKLVKIIGLPDKLFGINGRVIFVEFKRPGEVPRKIQIYWHNLLRSKGFSTYVVDNRQQFISIIKENFDGQAS